MAKKKATVSRNVATTTASPSGTRTTDVATRATKPPVVQPSTTPQVLRSYVAKLEAALTGGGARFTRCEVCRGSLLIE
jgi:hypothetical protein